MTDAVIHPTTEELAAFGLGKLPERAAAAVAAHLQSCSACRQAVAGVSADSFLGKVRDAGKIGSSFVASSAGQPAIPTAPSPNLPPELARHPKYLVLRELGRGGMGVVYQARHKEMDRQVVIKVISRSLLDRPDSLERFRREIRAAAQLSHSNIVTAYDAEQVGELHMLVMEFVPGRNLTEVVRLKGPLPISVACHFARQVALGLQHAYERNLVHRDIKPQNLMLTPKGQVKILDFGLAKVVREEKKSTGLTSDNTYLGTPDYCAPEQAIDAAKADIRADLYSLGCTLYYLLSGRPPFREDTVVKTILAHQQRQPQPLPELRPEVPAELWQIVARLLAKDPAKRYETPIEVAQTLAPFIKSGSKQEVKGVLTPAVDVSSPRGGTIIAADTGEIKNILRELPGKTPPKEAPAKKEAALPFAEPSNSRETSKRIVRVREEAKPYLSEWWKRPGVLAAAVSISLALILMTAVIVMVQTPYGTIVLEGLPPDAVVLVDGSSVTVKQVDGKTAEIRVTADKKHRLEVRIDGTAKVIGERVEIGSGERRPIRVRLVAEKGKQPPPVPDPAPGDNSDGMKRAKEGAGQTVKSQIEAVTAKMTERNPGFDGKLNPTIDGNGLVTGLEFLTHQVTDISPLRALPGLKYLSCRGSPSAKGKLADLSPLKGMHLTSLDVWQNPVSDLSPLKGMQLTYLDCEYTQVSDLAPLQGMPLTTLWCGNFTRISDLAPLKGMKLTRLNIWGIPVSDLSPLKGMPLISLGCSGTQISDLSPLTGMPLIGLYCDRTRVTDLSPLKGMPLKYLSCDFRPGRDTAILRSIETLETINEKPAAEVLKPADRPVQPERPAAIAAAGEKGTAREATHPSDGINRAINAGVVALRRLQQMDGSWPQFQEAGNPSKIGATALAGLTLLNCGAKSEDQTIVRAADAVRRGSINLTYNYAISLAILFLDKLGDPNDIPLIESLSVRLLAGQTSTGGWNYNSPPVPDSEVSRLQAKLAERKELAEKRGMPTPDGIKRTAKDLPKEIQQQLALIQRIGGKAEQANSDNSNTQFAMLALWVARRYGLPVQDALKRVGTRFRSSQHADGGWSYWDPNMKVQGQASASTPTMTCAGVLGLALADVAALEVMKGRNPQNKALFDFNKDSHLIRGLSALRTVIPQGNSKPEDQTDSMQIGGRSYYFLWSLERVAVALDLKTIGKKDWYEWGSGILLASQKADGTWKANYADCGADTCFALLFLKRANLTPDLTTHLLAR